MENASKALIIAGAILISILLIGVGVMVMNGAQGGIDEAIQKMSAQEKDMFNESFTRYAGEKVTGSNVRALIQNIISSNSANEEIEGKLVSLTIGSEAKLEPKAGDLKMNEMSAAKSKINTGAKYKVELEYSKGGLVEHVKVSPVSTTK